MTAETARKISTNPEVLKRLAKYLAQQCFRNTMLEDLHAGITPNSQTGDYSDVFVQSPYGQIPWSQARFRGELRPRQWLIGFEDQGFVAEVNQHRVVLEIEPLAEGVELEVCGPGPLIPEPTRQLFNENLLAYFSQDLGYLSVRVTLRNEIDPGLPH